jgi:hypothetical protein
LKNKKDESKIQMYLCLGEVDTQDNTQKNKVKFILVFRTNYEEDEEDKTSKFKDPLTALEFAKINIQGQINDFISEYKNIVEKGSKNFNS